ncbi:LLM class flavin-dependent oxidoreductase [Nocardia alni]|uniref:LLM class flavin-dependent oxidoreductase n=1 Tax=Nocardia alni TaxID=2815723 RepID=UPI001C217C79|nr:LLM class flavin-dependent oxidoreductase [Nocardia alni]
MRIGIRIPPCAPANEIAQFALEVERAGLDEVWLPDSQLLWRDVFAVAAAVAGVTSRIRLGTAVTNLVTRHPAVVASAARTVAELAPGRFVLGVGVGNSSVGPVGLRPSTGAELRSRLGVVRELLSGRRVDFGGVRTGLCDPVPVPIHMAASGPRNLRLAGEIADGAILLSGVAPEPLAAAIAEVRAGAAGRTPGPITVSAFCRITGDVARDARELKPVCLGIAHNGGASFLAKAGVRVAVPDRLPASYPDLLHAQDWDAAVRACDPYVDDDAVAVFAREFCLYGTAEEIHTRLHAIENAGAEAVFLQHVGSYDLPRRLLADVAGHLTPRLRAPVSG